MTDDQRFLIAIGSAWSALYVSGCFVVGLILHIALAWELALATAGACYVAYLVQVLEYQRPTMYAAAPVIISIILGISAGVTLLVA